MSIYLSRLFPRSNSSFSLCSGNALQSAVVRLREEMFLVDAGVGTPRICMQDELTGVPINQTTRFENKVGFQDLSAGESLIKKRILERLFIDLATGEPLIKERAATRFNDMVGSTDAVAGEPVLLLPRRFRQNRAWMELNKMWRTNTKVKGFIIEKVRGGYSVAIAAAASLRVQSMVPPLVAEAMAVWQGILLASNSGCAPFQIDSDSRQVAELVDKGMPFPC
ncbi:hypothetical protein QYF36_010275 [Acer negundo]|nr:hypothetical protein QYF36_010275 [Acer negundo]